MITREEKKFEGAGEVGQKVIFDKEILPLLKEIIQICEENGIPLMAAASVQSQGRQMIAVQWRGDAPLFRVANAIMGNFNLFLSWVDSLP